MIVGAVVLVFEKCCDWSPFFADDTQQMYKNITFGDKKQAIETGREALKLASTGDVADEAEIEDDDADGDKVETPSPPRFSRSLILCQYLDQRHRTVFRPTHSSLDLCRQ